MTTTATEDVRLPALDGLRAVAVLGVIASHSGLIGLGWVGVDIFFALSGYLITGILLDAKAAAPGARDFFVPFYMRRALRILPLAWLMVVVMATIRGQWSGLPWYLGYVVNWLPASPPPRDLGHFWSLAVEEQFYTLWPALVFFASRRTLWRVSIGLIVLDAALRLAVSIWPPEFATAQWRDLATFARADSLLAGALLAQRERHGGFGIWARRAWPLCITAALLLVAVRLAERSAVAPALLYNLKWPVVALGCGAGLLGVLVHRPRLLQWRPLVWLGSISYGVYVYHALFGGWLHSHFTLAQAPIIFALQLGLTLPLAVASWYLLESPLLALKRHWPRQPAAGVRAEATRAGPRPAP
jgi:peptidoglycan/LPS O-acetylase OafA/YrhL